MRKKGIAVLLSLSMILSLAPITVFAGGGVWTEQLNSFNNGYSVVFAPFEELDGLTDGSGDPISSELKEQYKEEFRQQFHYLEFSFDKEVVKVLVGNKGSDFLYGDTQWTIIVPDGTTVNMSIGPNYLNVSNFTKEVFLSNDKGHKTDRFYNQYEGTLVFPDSVTFGEIIEDDFRLKEVVYSIEFGLISTVYNSDAGIKITTEEIYNKYHPNDANAAIPSEQPSATDFTPAVSSDKEEYIYDEPDLGGEVVLPVKELDNVEDTDDAVQAVESLTKDMTTEEKSSATGIDLATLYAETAVSKAASKEVSGDEIIIDAAAVSDLEEIAKETSKAVETALINGGITTARYLSDTVTLVTDEVGEVKIKIDPDVLTTDIDKIRVETPTYALTLKLSDLAADLKDIITITAQDVGAGYALGSGTGKTTVKVNLPNGKTSNPVTLSLPSNSGSTTYQAVVNTEGTATSSKYNPATTDIDGKINTSGQYTVVNNEKNFSDIQNKSAEMQAAIRYLASKGIISGTTETGFSPDASISRAEIAMLLVKALGKLDSSAVATFADVQKSNWYYTAAASSQKHKLISGYEDNTFRGPTAINKEQIVSVASRVLTTEMGYKAPSNPATYLAKYSDTVAGWAQGQVALATKENLVVYRTDGTFSGAKNMTRGDAAIIIYRLFQKIW